MRSVAIAFALVLVTSGAALASGGDPQKKITAADQARAKAMLLRKSDLAPGFKVDRSSGGDTSFDCPALDESDLTWTGHAESGFSAGAAFAQSEAQVYESESDASEAWKRDTSKAGLACLKAALRRDFAKQGLALKSFRPLAFPRLSDKSAAYRMVVSGQSQGTSVPVYFDTVVLLHSRAEVLIGPGSALTPPPRAEEVRLARLTARRMATAMGGG